MIDKGRRRSYILPRIAPRIFQQTPNSVAQYFGAELFFNEFEGALSLNAERVC